MRPPFAAAHFGGLCVGPRRGHNARVAFRFSPAGRAQRQRPHWLTAAAFSGCLWPPRAARRAIKRARATAAVLGGPQCPRTQGAAQGALWHCRAVPAFGWRRGRVGLCEHKAKPPGSHERVSLGLKHFPLRFERAMFRGAQESALAPCASALCAWAHGGSLSRPGCCFRAKPLWWQVAMSNRRPILRAANANRRHNGQPGLCTRRVTRA